MKQHITVEQLKELTEEQKQRLKDWWKPGAGDFYVVWDDHVALTTKESKEYINKENCTPLLSIGQMIELLHKKDAVNHHFIQAYHNMWRVNTHENIELCDALWEAVKALL